MSGTAEADPRANFFAALPCRIGEILITQAAANGYDLRHRDDAGRGDLVRYADANAALEIARFDDAGKYRPLKTAPNLRRGWQLVLGSAADVCLAVDFFYPGRVAALFAQQRGDMRTTSLRETLGRQTGMYRIAARVTDQEVDELVGNFCRSDRGCLRTILWPKDESGASASTLLPAEKFELSYDQTGRGEATLPLLCPEACNLLVAAARTVVKSAVE